MRLTGYNELSRLKAGAFGFFALIQCEAVACGPDGIARFELIQGLGYDDPHKSSRARSISASRRFHSFVSSHERMWSPISSPMTAPGNTSVSQQRSPY